VIHRRVTWETRTFITLKKYIANTMSGGNNNNVVYLDSCTQGREDSDIERLASSVIEYAWKIHKMRLTHQVEKRRLNFVYFQAEVNFVITRDIIMAFGKRFKGSSLSGNTWSVPIDANAVRERSLSPGERTHLSQNDAWMYHTKMIIIYSVSVILFALKLVM
jgi:hypothetical protein